MCFSFVFLISNGLMAIADGAREQGYRGFGGIPGNATPGNGAAWLSRRECRHGPRMKSPF